MKTQLLTVLATLTVCFSANANLDKAVQEMNEFQKPMVAALKAALTTDPELKNEYAFYVKELKDLEPVKDADLRMKLMIEVNHKHRNLFDKAMKKAKVDTAKSKKKAKELSLKYSSKDIRLAMLAGEYLTYSAWIEQRQQNEPPAETEVEFTAPFAFEHSSQGGGGDIRVNLESGKFAADANSYFLGSYKNKAGLGDFVRIPWGNRTVRVSAKLPEVNVHLASCAIIGGGGAKASSVIDVLTEDGRTCIKKIDHGTVVAPGVWYATLDMIDTTILACEMVSPPANQDITVRFQSIADVTTGANASAIANVSSKPDPIRVRLIE